MKKTQFAKFKEGGVSIFLVVAACLMVSIVVASFIRVMIRDEQQASQQDLSQSAYDSAQAGVEDAKRFLLKFQKSCGNGEATTECENMRVAMEKQDCRMLGAGGIGSSTSETQIQTNTSANDKDLNQAYTCVKMQTKTDDFLGEVAENGSKIIPLKGSSPFNRVKIQWFMRADLADASNNTVDLANTASRDFPINDGKTWTKNHPPVLSSQFVSLRSGGNAEEFNTNGFGNKTGTSTTMLYPADSSIAVNEENNKVHLSAVDSKKKTGDGSNAPAPVICNKNLNDKVYACSTYVEFGEHVNTDTTAFMRLAMFYNKASFSIKLYNGNDLVQFDGVQPKVDSTGRANDNFRRVESRIEAMDNNFPYPDFALDASGGDKTLCKDFMVTNLKQYNLESCE